MRKNKQEFNLRDSAYKIRLFTMILEIFWLVGMVIGLIIITIQCVIAIAFSILGIVGYILLFVWILSFDIYYTCVLKRYYDKSFTKKPRGDYHLGANTSQYGGYGAQPGVYSGQQIGQYPTG